jgi:hypothetical protein
MFLKTKIDSVNAIFAIFKFPKTAMLYFYNVFRTIKGTCFE